MNRLPRDMHHVAGCRAPSRHRPDHGYPARSERSVLLRWGNTDPGAGAVPGATLDLQRGAERVERTVLEVAAGIEDQDFEPRPSYEICSWCDYRLICPASEA